MKIKYNLTNSALYLYFIGELDECTANKTRDFIDNLILEVNGINRVVFNLKDLSFMDSTGIGMLIGRYKKLKKIGISVYIENPSVATEKIIEVAGLYKIMPKV